LQRGKEPGARDCGKGKGARSTGQGPRDKGQGTRGKGKKRNLEKRGCGKGRKRLGKWKMGNMENEPRDLASARIEKQD